ncbi:MAG: 2-oxo-4-hydroxy-4-carboxy-5-ureidoimidazoline decarboxylase [Rhodocyclaceae bacterium]
MTTLQTLSAFDRDAFIAALDGIFEHSPWVAGAAWEKRPFTSFDALHDALVQAMWNASHAQQLALVRAHPELAGRAAVRGEFDRRIHPRTGWRAARRLHARGIRPTAIPQFRL